MEKKFFPVSNLNSAGQLEHSWGEEASAFLSKCLCQIISCEKGSPRSHRHCQLQLMRLCVCVIEKSLWPIDTNAEGLSQCPWNSGGNICMHELQFPLAELHIRVTSALRTWTS